jgi:hypothetical protein
VINSIGGSWIPAFAGMTIIEIGMTIIEIGMTIIEIIMDSSGDSPG